MATNVQTTYDFAPAAGLPGQIARFKPGQFAKTLIAFAALVPGLVMFTGRAVGGVAGQVGPMTASAASPTALIASGGGSTAGIQTLTTFNGALGPAGSELFPPRNVTLTLSSHADWDATTAVVSGTDVDGVAITENLTIPNGGNATVTGATVFRTITQLVIPAQSGTGGTFTFGVGSVFGVVDHLVEGIVERDITRSAVNFPAGEPAPILRVADVYVTSETAVTAGDPVWVRVQASGDEVLGAVRATPDGTKCVRMRHARFSSSNSAGLSRIDLNLPG